MEDAPLLTGSVPGLEVVASTDVNGDRPTVLVINKEEEGTLVEPSASEVLLE
ncbi:MAG: hypothetical protein KJ935_07795 [Candidatus Omnitrophica bacterium]|nr:hypothetical protein [Candidatus Omnitrophota bacterium]